MSNDHRPHMTPDEFRKHGRTVIDWIANYMESVESLPVLSKVKPGEIRASLPPDPPSQGEDIDAIMRDLDAYIMPGITHWQSPNFYAFFPSNTSGPSIFGDLLSAGLAVQGMSWETSPACTELETHVLDWLADIMGLPEAFTSRGSGGGVIQDTASSSTLCALLAARERATGFKTNQDGMHRKMVVYTSEHAHSSVEKAVRIAGIGDANLRKIPVDDSFAMRADALADAIRDDREAGLLPVFVCVTVGTTSSNAIDPLSDIVAIAKRESVWVHVDAAMSGNAAICPEYRHILDGIDGADSYCFNPHKWMFTNFDCDCFYVADREVLTRTLSILPEYLRNRTNDVDAAIDYRDWQIPLGRRFRSLKLWFVIRYYGVKGLQKHISDHIELAQEFASWVRDDDEFELVVKPPLNLVCFRHRDGDDRTKNLLESLNASGKLYVTHTTLNDQYVIRFCVGQAQTERHHVEAAWAEIKRVARQQADSP